MIRIKIIILITFLAIYTFNKLLIQYSMKLLTPRNKILTKISPITLALISMTLIYYKTYIPAMYIILFLAYMIIFKMVFDSPIGEVYVIIINQIFFLILFRDITLSALSLLTGKTMYQTIQCFETYVLSFAICRLLMFIGVIYFAKICNLQIAKKLLLNEKKLRMSDVAVVGLIIMLLNSNYTYYYLGNVKSTLFITLINRLCIIFWFYFSLNIKIKTMRWVEEEVLYKTTLVSLEENEKINEKMDEYSQLLKIYNHDLKKILLNIKDTLEIGNTEQAKDIINQYNGRIEQISSNNKKFSNNNLVNCLLNRLKEECEGYNIHFDADCYIPTNLQLADIDLINIFNNLSSNAFEACIKQDITEKKSITFKSYIKEKFLVIYQSNSFNGQIKFRNQKLVTTKENKKVHGIGVKSIKFIVEQAKGMTLIKVDEEKREFKFLIKIPLA